MFAPYFKAGAQSGIVTGMCPVERQKSDPKGNSPDFEGVFSVTPAGTLFPWTAGYDPFPRTGRVCRRPPPVRLKTHSGEVIMMVRIIYAEKIRKRGWFGIPYTTLKLRCAHVDPENWRRLRGRPFSLASMMLSGCAAGD